MKGGFNMNFSSESFRTLYQSMVWYRVLFIINICGRLRIGRQGKREKKEPSSKVIERLNACTK